MAETIGIGEVNADLLPEQKLEIVKMLSENETVLFLGDGINDAPALAAADIGIAMGVIASDAAIETADIALMDEDLSKIPRLIERAKKTMSIVHQNVVISISVKLVIGFLAMLGLISLWVAVGIGDMGLTLLVIVNALRLVRKNKVPDSVSPIQTERSN